MYCWSHLEYVKDADSAQAIWTRLCFTFEPKGTLSKIYLLKKILTMKFIEWDESMEVFNALRQCTQTSQIGRMQIEEETVAWLILLTLPESYSVVMTAIETFTDDKITISFVKWRLLDEVVKRQSISEDSRSQSHNSTAFESNAITVENPATNNFNVEK